MFNVLWPMIVIKSFLLKTYRSMYLKKRLSKFIGKNTCQFFSVHVVYICSTSHLGWFIYASRIFYPVYFAVIFPYLYMYWLIYDI